MSKLSHPMDAHHDLNELWTLYTSSSRSRIDQNKSCLLQYLEEFVGVYQQLTDVLFFEKNVAEDGKVNKAYSSCYHIQSDGSVVLDHLPDLLIRIIQTQLMTLQHQCPDLNISNIKLATYLVQALIVICRTKNTLLRNLSSSFVEHVVAIASQVILMLRKCDPAKERDKINLERFLENTFHFIECLYDPHFAFKRKQKSNLPTPSDITPLLNVEVIPFFYETLQIHTNDLSMASQQQLLRMLGAILSGDQRNALLATSSTTLEILLKYLSQYIQHNAGGPAVASEPAHHHPADCSHDESIRLVLRLIVTMVHTLHNSGSGQCQLDVKTVIGEYLKLLSDADTNPDMQLLMIGFVPEILNTRDRPALQMMLLQHGCLERLKEVLVNFRANPKVDEKRGNNFAIQFTNIVNCLVSGSMSAKDLFSKTLGSPFMLEQFKAICTPSNDVLTALLNMGLEVEDVLKSSEPIKNVFIVLMLFDWLPDIQQVEQQVWLSSVLSSIFTSCVRNKIIACHCQLVEKVIACLVNNPALYQQTVLNLIGLIEELGSYSFTHKQTLAFLELLRQDSSTHEHLNKYFNNLLQSLSVMAARNKCDVTPAYFFDLQGETSGITAPTINKWGGPGFTVHVWVCLEYFPHKKNSRKRRQLYSFSNDHGVGMEAFFTADCHLVLSVSTKKNYFTVKLNEYPFTDNKWHCVQILHTSSRKMFASSGLLQVYVDNQLKLSTSLRFPALSDKFTLCHIGSPGHRTNATPSPDSIKSFFNENNSGNTDRVVVIDNGSQDDIWGQATSLLGQLGPVLVLNDVLKEGQLYTLYHAGPDMWESTRANDSPFEDIPSSKIVLYFEAKACFKHVCKDLSCNKPERHGHLAGHKVFTFDIKNSINYIGGISLLTPLMETIHLRQNSGSEDLDRQESLQTFFMCISYPAGKIRSFHIDSTSQDVESMFKRLVGHLKLFLLRNADDNQKGRSLGQQSNDIIQYPVASFILVLASFVTNSNNCLGWHSINAEMMVNCATVSTIGALLQKISIALIDENLLRSIQHFVTLVNNAEARGSVLLMDLYQYLLFDFRIWSLADAATQNSHVQYLAILTRECKKKFRSSFGVQFIIDVINTFYCSSDSDLSDADASNIRLCLLDIIKNYVTDDITSNELLAMFNFMSTTKPGSLQVDEEPIFMSSFKHIIKYLAKTQSGALGGCRTEICEVLELIVMLSKCPCCEQLFILLSESQYADYLYPLLCLPDYSDDVRCGVCEILVLLFKSNRFAAKHKAHLKQTSIGFSGILMEMQQFTISPKLADLLYKAIKLTDVDGATFMSLAKLLCGTSVSTRTSLCQHFLMLAYSKAAFLQDCAQQKAWQETMTELFIVESTPADPTESMLPHLPSSSTLSSHDTIPIDDEVQDLFPSRSSSLANGDIDARKSTSSDIKEDFFLQRSQSNGSVLTGDTSSFVIIDPNEARIGVELIDLAVESLFLIMWRGVTGSSASAWKERGQVFSCLNQAASANQLLHCLDDIKASILEHCVEAALSDIRESSASSSVIKATGMTLAVAKDNCSELVRLIHDFLTTDGVHKCSLWTEKLMHNVFALYDALAVWGVNNQSIQEPDRNELINIGLWLLCGCVKTGKVDLVAMASAKLHHLIYSRPPASTEEVCFLLDSLHSSITASIKANSDVKEFVVPLVRDLLDKNFEELEMGPQLSELPPTTGSSSFFDDFLSYCMLDEWVSFINTTVQPNALLFQHASFDNLTLNMTAFWTGTTEEFMAASLSREMEKKETELRFKANFDNYFYKRREMEEDRQSKNSKSLKNQNTAVLRQWRAAKRFLASERGLWKDRYPGPTYYKLSNVENFSRMRLKLTENYNFTLHEDASRLRDNRSVNDIKDQPSQEAVVPPSAILTSSDSSKEDDSVGDEDWSILASNPTSPQDEQVKREKVILSKDCQLITLMDVVEGKLEVTTTHVYFYDKSTANEEGTDSGMDFKWALSQLREVHFRRYNLRKSALELFLIDQTNYFINFLEPKLRHTVYKALLSVRPPNLLYYGTRTPQELLKASGLTQKWIQREVSNFDYLMQLNTIAGRTYNDLSQYPVFPWILQDYTSEKLDLTNPSVYRDLSRPVGVLNPNNEHSVRERYDQFEDPNGVISKFHYGSHYSNAATVLFYMLRMEPFTTLHIQLQAGRFDLSDRQFHSLPTTFQAIMDTTNDVKELIPEFFCMPEFLVNLNGFDLGKLQFSGEAVNDVILPKWARSPSDFVFQHRKALESEYVSSNLHNWIDLIFGYKQRGEEAIKALNVFYYCTYEGAVDLNAISDPMLRKAVEGMINNFGQTPTQLLTDPHPKRMSREDATRKVLGSRIMSTLSVGVEKGLNVLEEPDQLKPFFVEVMPSGDSIIFVSVPRNQSHSFIQSGMPDAMVTVSEQGVIGVHGWLPYDRSITNYFTFEKDLHVGPSKQQKNIKGLLSPGLHLSTNIFLTTHDAKYLFIAGYWDNSIRVMTVKGKAVTSFTRHMDVVTCLALDHGGSYLMSGSYDTTSIIWKVTYSSGVSSGITVQPLHILYGHEDVVTCVVINLELDVALSSSKDGTCIMHSVRKGNYVRTIRPFTNNPHLYTVPSVAMSDEGRIVLYARTHRHVKEEKHFLHLFSINGQHLALDCLEARLGHMTISGEHLVTGDAQGLLLVRDLFSFQEVSRLTLRCPISCVFVTKSMTHILACLRDGKLIIVGVDRPAKSRGLFTTTSGS